VAGGTLATATAGKLAAVVCTAALTAGGAVEVNKLRSDHRAASGPAAQAASPAPARAAEHSAATPVLSDRPMQHPAMSAQPITGAGERADRKRRSAKERRSAAVPPVTTKPEAPADPLKTTTPTPALDGAPTTGTGTGTPQAGGVAAPEQATPGDPGAGSVPGAGAPTASPQAPTTPTQKQPTGAPADAGGAAQNGAVDGTAPPPEH
jgi:hypothetical protein